MNNYFDFVMPFLPKAIKAVLFIPMFAYSWDDFVDDAGKVAEAYNPATLLFSAADDYLSGDDITAPALDEGGNPANAEKAVRDPYREMYDSLRAQVDIAPEVYEAEAKFRPQYAQLNWGIQKDIIGGKGGTLDFMENTIMPASQRMTDKARADQIETLKKYGPGAVEAFLNVDPKVNALLTKMTDSAMTGSDSELSKELEKQALAELKAGGDVTPDELRNIQQASRTAWAARGLVHSNPAVLDEITNSEAFRNMRKDQRRAFATGIESMRMSRSEADRAFAGNVTTTRSNMMRDPLSIIMQDPLYSLAYGQNQQTFGTQYSNATPQMFNPMNDYMSNLNSQNSKTAFNTWNTQYQGNLDKQFAQMDVDAAERAARYQLVGDIIGAGSSAAAGM